MATTTQDVDRFRFQVADELDHLAAQREAEQIIAQAHDYDRASAGPNFDNSVAAREALRVFGEMMISHMQAAARHLDDGSEQLARTMDRIAKEMTPSFAVSSYDQPTRATAALPRHEYR